MTNAPTIRKLWPRNTPERHRLESDIAELDGSLNRIHEASRKVAWFSAYQHLCRARQHLTDDNLHAGWAALQSAQREWLLDPEDSDKVHRAAIKLRRELTKVNGWRAHAIKDLICNDQDQLLPNIPPRRVLEAVALRDDHFQTHYFKILMRQRHLFQLFVFLLVGIALGLTLSVLGVLPAPFNQIGLMTGVVLFGALGAGLSVARGLLGADLNAKIPAQQLGAVVIWMRPAIGAAAALISFVLMSAKIFKFFDLNETNAVNIFTIAIAAGFSERFIVGAIEGMADSSAKPESGKAASKT